MAGHDNSYKLLFSHPRLVEDLLRGFLPAQWVSQLDFSSLQKVSGHVVSDNLRHRESDVIWRVRWGREPGTYVYVLIEFQSRPDHLMALRLQTYVGLLYQDLARRKQFNRDVFAGVHGSRPGASEQSSLTFLTPCGFKNRQWVSYPPGASVFLQGLEAQEEPVSHGLTLIDLPEPLTASGMPFPILH